jgi:hypothetical protein
MPMDEIRGADAADAISEAIRVFWSRYGNIDVRYERVSLDSLQSVIYQVARRRLNRAELTLSQYRQDGCEPYLPTRYTDDQGSVRVGFGPLVEVHEGSHILIDGTHRSLAALHAGLEYIFALTIRPDHAPPPVKPAKPLKDVRVLEGDMDRLPRFSGKDSKDFRPSALFTTQAERYVLMRASVG